MKKTIEDLRHHGRNASACIEYNLKRIVKAVKAIEIAVANIREEDLRVEGAIKALDKLKSEDMANVDQG